MGLSNQFEAWGSALLQHRKARGLRLPSICVIGGGIGGLVAALALSQFGCRVNVYEKNQTRDELADGKMGKYLGLWSPALRCLDGLGIWDRQEDIRREFIVKSSYRTVAGSCLAHPSGSFDVYDTQSTASRPALAFCDESALLRVLLAHAEVRESISLHFGAPDSSDVPGVIKVMNECDADLIVAADGANSEMRSLFFPGTNFLCEQGYIVIRGKTVNRVYDDAFQTWGDGARFAAVPVNEGNAWFATLTKKRLGNIHLASLVNDKGAVARLLEKEFRNWHHPIPSFISEGDVISAQNAVAFKKCHSRGLSGIFDISTSLDRDCIPCAFIGDAAHLQDPILAQGANCSIEDAFHLADCVASMIVRHEDGWGRTALNVCFREYEERRKCRLQRLHFVSNLAQSIGQIDGVFMNAVRDKLLLSLPHALKSRIFDIAIMNSLSSEPMTTAYRAVQVDPLKMITFNNRFP